MQLHTMAIKDGSVQSALSRNFELVNAKGIFVDAAVVARGYKPDQAI